MRLLAISDTQLNSGKTLGVENRLADQVAMLEQIIDIADTERVDAILHCGDVFQSRHPSEEARLIFKGFAERAIDGGARRFVIVAGNHDLTNAELPSSVDLYDDCEFYRRPAVIGDGLAVLPWTPPHRLAASRNGGSRDILNSDVAELLLAAALDLYEKMDEGPKLLALHWAVSGAPLPTGISTEALAEPVIPLADLAAIGFDTIAAGHIHQAGIFHDPPPVFYCGSPWVNDWGEAHLEHGVWIIEEGVPRFRALEDRPFRRLFVDFTEGDDFSRLIEEPQAFKSYEDAVVHVSFRANSEQAKRVSHHEVKAALAEAGAYSVAAMKWDPVREDRARVEGVDENLDAAEAMRKWLESQGIDGERATELEERGQRYLEDVRA